MEMRRKDLAVTDPAKIDAIIQGCDCIRLAFADGTHPYIVPLSFGYVREGDTAKFYFHGAANGRKVDLSRKLAYAGFELDRNRTLKSDPKACDFSFAYESVVGEGSITELTTREEAHMLCYFRTVQACMAFGEEIYAHLAPTPNDERFFGRQQVMNEQDEEIGVEERLLIGALDLPFEACAARIHAAGGLCVPAHINRGSSGVLGALGFLPQGVRYDALEVSLSAPPPSVDVTGYRLLHSSDAHHLEQILEPEFTLEARERSVDAVFDAIAGLSI